MHVVSLNNEQNIILFSVYHALEIVAENFSYEIAEYFREILWNQEKFDEYVTNLEKENDSLANEKEKLKDALTEFNDRELRNDEYFKYLIENCERMV